MIQTFQFLLPFFPLLLLLFSKSWPRYTRCSFSSWINNPLFPMSHQKSAPIFPQTSFINNSNIVPHFVVASELWCLIFLSFLFFFFFFFLLFLFHTATEGIFSKTKYIYLAIKSPSPAPAANSRFLGHEGRDKRWTVLLYSTYTLLANSALPYCALLTLDSGCCVYVGGAHWECLSWLNNKYGGTYNSGCFAVPWESPLDVQVPTSLTIRKLSPTFL